jgi:hypothetical protein
MKLHNIKKILFSINVKCDVILDFKIEEWPFKIFLFLKLFAMRYFTRVNMKEAYLSFSVNKCLVKSNLKL